jgi:glycosyltransferase involved in cell wall biosynthesis
MSEVGKLCLCMIVKNEASVIRRCIDSVRPIIDRWLIVDTGSTDGTQNIIRDYLKDIEGTLDERPWRDFATNRSEALALARPMAAYSLIIDADDVLEIPDGYQLPDLDADSYVLDIVHGGTRYQRPQLVKNTLPWRYLGVLHEFLDCSSAGPAGQLPLVIVYKKDGARSRVPDLYRKDAEILENALQNEKEPFLIARYTFYLAQSYRDCGEISKAIDAYLLRSTMGYWQDEVFVSLYEAAKLKELWGSDRDEVIALYLRASEALPSRAEAFHAASKLCRHEGRNRQGYEIAKQGLGLTPPAHGLFVETWIYEFGLFDEHAVNAYWAGEYLDCVDSCHHALESKALDQETRARILRNARFALDKLQSLKSSSDSKTASPHLGLAPDGANAPKVLIAILAKDKAGHLPLFLKCIEALDYPKERLYFHIRTNNNTDCTADLLRSWVERAGKSYAHVELDDRDVPERVQDFADHEWNATRFSVLGRIRQHSMERSLALGCDFYFVADVDNFVRPSTLRALVALNVPIVAPLLKSADVDNPHYSNFHESVDGNGYFVASERYDRLLNRRPPGLHEVALVHCTYLVRADVIPMLTFDDGSERYEYVIFAHSARSAEIQQILDTREIYGWVTFASNGEAARKLLAADLPL